MSEGEKKPYPIWHPEQVKLVFEHTKHITTIATASILVLVSFLQKIAEFNKWKFLLAVSLLSFIACITTTLFAQGACIDMMREDQKPDPKGAKALVFSYISFLIGIIALAAFAFRNLF